MACGQNSSLATPSFCWDLAVPPPAPLSVHVMEKPKLASKWCLSTTEGNATGKLMGIFGQKEIFASLKPPGVSQGCAKPHHFQPSLGGCEVMSWAVLSWDPVLLHLKIIFQSLSWAVVMGHQRGLWVLFLDVVVSWGFWESQQRHCRLCLLQREDFYIYFTQMHTATLETCILFWLFSTWWDCSACWLTVECLD